MNLQEIINEINKDIDDSLPNGDLIGWINRCIDDLSPHAQYQKSSSITLITNQKEYDLPSDYQRLVYLVNEIPLNQVEMKDFASNGFKLWGNKLVIQPTPTQDGSLDLYYEAKIPHLVNLSDEPQIPSQFHDLFIFYTVARRQYQDDEEARQMNAMSEYNQRKNDFIKFMTQNIEPSTIEDVYGYGC
jgi:hypothetical protein